MLGLCPAPKQSRLASLTGTLRGKLMTGREFDLERHAPAARALALSIVGNQADADDVVQEAMLAAFEHRGELDQGRHPKAWLLQIALNKARDLLRRKRVRSVSPSGLEGVTTPVTTEDVDAVRRAFQSLPVNARAVMHLAYYEEMAYAEIAETLGTSVGAVKMTILRGRELLRGMLKESNDDVR